MKIQDVFGLGPLNTGVQTSLYTDDEWKGRLIGIEVEVEDISKFNQSKASVWSVTSDGSLRNNGHEFITVPIPWKAHKTALQDLMRSINEDCAFSCRTSIHIHVNVRDLTSTQVKLATHMYLLAEDSLYKFVGMGRKDNIFCIPVLATKAYCNPGTSISTVASRWSKYNGFNLAPLANYGTIEFRHMAGRKDLESLSQWIEAIVSIVDQAEQIKPSEFYSMLSGMTWQQFVDKLAPAPLQRILQRYPTDRPSEVVTRVKVLANNPGDFNMSCGAESMKEVDLHNMASKYLDVSRDSAKKKKSSVQMIVDEVEHLALHQQSAQAFQEQGLMNSNPFTFTTRG